MNQFELVESIQAVLANSISMFVAFVSVVSAYAIVAYLVGAKLKKLQLVLLNSLFVIVAALLTLSQYSLLSMYLELTNRLNTIDPNWPDSIEYWEIVVIPLLWVVIVLGCLKFMWDAREAAERGS